jgi:asparaginyl-tRNA synthetase
VTDAQDTTRQSLPTPREHLDSEVTRDVLRLQQEALVAAREHLRALGFVEMLPPMIGPVTDPGIRGSKQVDVDYYGHRYKLMTSAILYKQASLLAFDKIFCIAPNVRLEPVETATTHRHLVEFHQIDVEMAGGSAETAMDLVEGLVVHVVGAVRERMGAELERLGRDPDAFAGVLRGEFARRPHAEVVAGLRDGDVDQDPGAELDWRSEELVSRKSDAPFFVTRYPKGSRGFYDREDPDEPGSLRNFDLIMPDGYGELCSGAEREFDRARIIARMRETGENPAKYAWYLDMARDGIPASAGFGVGLERLTRYLAGLDATWQASAFPKLAGQATP